jgi:hypothetical protein
MPVRKCSNGKWRIGSGDCIYDTKKSAESAYAGYRASKYGENHTMSDAEYIREMLDKTLAEESEGIRKEPLSAEEIIALARELNVDPKTNEITQMHIFEFAMGIQHALGYPVAKPKPLPTEPANPDPGLD